jgi:hypothetical protein
VENTKSFCCENWRDGCNFTVWKVSFGHDVTEEEARVIIEGDDLGPLILKNKDGKPYRGILYLDKDTGKVKMKFPPRLEGLKKTTNSQEEEADQLSFE